MSNVHPVFKTTNGEERRGRIILKPNNCSCSWPFQDVLGQGLLKQLQRQPMSSSRMSSFSSSCIRNLQMFPTFFMTDSKQDPLLFGFLKKEFSDRIPFFAEASRQKILWLYAWKQCLFLPHAFKSTSK